MGNSRCGKKKRFSRDFVHLELYVLATEIRARGTTLWQQFVKLLVRQREFTPERYDPYREPPRYMFERENTGEVLRLLSTPSQSILFERYDLYYMFYTIDTGSIHAAGPDNFEGVSAEGPYLNTPGNCSKFVQIGTELYGLFRPLYARAAHNSDSNNQNKVYTYFPEGHPRAGEVYSITGFGGDIRKGIPGIYWANFFSRIYVDTIGREKFLTAPCYSRRDLPDGGFLLLTSASPLEWDKPEVQELRRRMRDHLGYEYFCDIENPKRKCKVPKFDFSVWEKECERGMKIPERLQV